MPWKLGEKPVWKIRQEIWLKMGIFTLKVILRKAARVRKYVLE